MANLTIKKNTFVVSAASPLLIIYIYFFLFCKDFFFYPSLYMYKGLFIWWMESSRDKTDTSLCRPFNHVVFSPRLCHYSQKTLGGGVMRLAILANVKEWPQYPWLDIKGAESMFSWMTAIISSANEWMKGKRHFFLIRMKSVLLSLSFPYNRIEIRA